MAKLTLSAYNLIEAFERSVRDDDQSGSLPPDEVPIIHAAYLKAKEELTDYISNLMTLAYD